MKSNFLIILSLGMSLSALAQDPFAKKYAAVITAESARKHLSILASDEFEGRETGKAGAEKAAQYLKAEFRKMGLKGPVNGDYFQKVEMYEKTQTLRMLAVNGKALEPKDFTLTSFTGPKTTFTDFVFVGYGISGPKYDDLTTANVEGKVMIVLSGEPQANGIFLSTGTAAQSPSSSARTKTAALRAKKPALIITVLPAAGRGFVTGSQMVLSKEVPANAVNLISLSAETVNSLLASTGKTIADIQKAIIETGKPAPLQVKSALTIDVAANFNPVDAKEVMGFLEGSDPKLKEEVLVISSHYDHEGLTTAGTDKVMNGADDDGSGTTGVLEIARAFSKAKKENHGPKRSILFLGHIGEEKGLLGSQYYSEHPVFPMAKTIANLNIDMIGRVGYEYIGKPDSANYVYVIGSAMLSSTLRKVSEEANKNYLNMVTDYKYDDPADPNRFYYRSDHYNFAKHNVPIIFYFNGVHDDYHKASDEVSKINFPLLAKRAQLAFYTGWELANRAERPLVDSKSPMSTR